MRTVIKLFFPALSCVLFFSPRLAAESVALKAPSNWDLKGVFRTEGLFYQKPSGLAGSSEFRIPFASIEGTADVLSTVSLDFELRHTSPSSANQNSFQLHRLGAIVKPKSMENVEVGMGLIQPAFVKLMKTDWHHFSLSSDLNWVGERWGYWNSADYGLQISQQNGALHWGLGVVNGVGPFVQRQGPQKDGFIWGAWRFTSSPNRESYLLTHLTHGEYDNIPSVDAAKDRFMVSLWTKAKRGLSAGIEIWSLRDPADAITQKVADKVDLALLAGQRVKGQILSTKASYRFGEVSENPETESWEIFYRSDLVEPVMGEAATSVSGDSFAFVYSPQAGVEWALLYTDISYGKDHSLGVREQAMWRLSFNVTWD